MAFPARARSSEGDLVKLDLVAEKDGYFADAAITVTCGAVSPAARELARCAETAFWQAAKAAVAGNRIFDIGRAVERETRRCGFHVMRELCGHGVGRTIHEAPSIPNYHDSRFRQRLTEGLVITIEPIIAAGSGQGVQSSDGWTIHTADRSWSAHYEHSVVITKGEPILLTAAASGSATSTVTPDDRSPISLAFLYQSDIILMSAKEVTQNATGT